MVAFNINNRQVSVDADPTVAWIPEGTAMSILQKPTGFPPPRK